MRTVPSRKARPRNWWNWPEPRPSSQLVRVSVAALPWSPSFRVCSPICETSQSSSMPMDSSPCRHSRTSTRNAVLPWCSRPTPESLRGSPALKLPRSDSERAERAAAFARQHRCVLLLKGAGTIVADEDAHLPQLHRQPRHGYRRFGGCPHRRGGRAHRLGPAGVRGRGTWGIRPRPCGRPGGAGTRPDRAHRDRPPRLSCRMAFREQESHW